MTDINLNSPNKGLLSDAMTDVPVDSAAAGRTSAPEGLTLAEEEELRSELAKVTGHPRFCQWGPCVAVAAFCWEGTNRSRTRGCGLLGFCFFF